MAVVATGFFDGVHLGHRQIIETLVQEAHRRSDRSLIITFWPHPRVQLQDEARNLKLLTTMEEKEAILRSLGVDEIVVLPFTGEFASMDAESYLSGIVKEKYGATAVVVGYDSRLGSDLAGPDRIEEISRGLGMDVLKLGSFSFDGQLVSSTVVRNLISSGEVELASSMLGYPYSIDGIVVPGKQMGRTIGFPTANIGVTAPLKIMPGFGVYLTKVEVLGRSLFGMTNVGEEATETHILDFSEDIYGREIRVSFVSRLRSEMHFSDFEELKAQLLKDEKVCRALIENL